MLEEEEEEERMPALLVYLALVHLDSSSSSVEGNVILAVEEDHKEGVATCKEGVVICNREDHKEEVETYSNSSSRKRRHLKSHWHHYFKASSQKS